MESTEERLKTAVAALDRLIVASGPFWKWQMRLMTDDERHEMEIARIHALNAVNAVKS